VDRSRHVHCIFSLYREFKSFPKKNTYGKLFKL